LQICEGVHWKGASNESRVGFLPWQKVFLPGQWKKPVKTGNNWQQLAKTVVHKTG